MSKIVNNMTPLGFVDKSRKKRYYINQNTKEIYVAEEPTQKSISIIMFAIIVLPTLLSSWAEKSSRNFFIHTNFKYNILIIFLILLVTLSVIVLEIFFFEKLYTHYVKRINYQKEEISLAMKQKILSTGIKMWYFTRVLLFVVPFIFLGLAISFIMTSQLTILVLTVCFALLILILFPITKRTFQTIGILKGLVQLSRNVKDVKDEKDERRD